MKRIYIYLTCLIVMAVCFQIKAIDIVETYCNQKTFSTGIEEKPGFGWVMTSEKRNASQTAYQILVSDRFGLLLNNTGDIWNSGRVESDNSINVIYNGLDLEPGKKYFWKVKIWDNEGVESGWSMPGYFITGLIGADWQGAQWIAYEPLPDSQRIVPGIHSWGHDLDKYEMKKAVIPLFRKEFNVDKKVESAFLFISGIGQYEAGLNGQKVSEYLLLPGWTDYDKTCLYNTFDVTDFIHKGENCIGAMVGPGFSYIGKEKYRKFIIAYGYPKMIALLKVKYSDGSEDVIVSDETWKTAPSPITFSSMYAGEHYDAMKEMPGWDLPGYQDVKWKDVVSLNDPTTVLKPGITYPNRVMEVFDPVNTSGPDPNTIIYDFGQNAAGVLEVMVKGRAGDKVRFLPGELLTEEGYINQRATGRPHVYEYTLRGDSLEIWRPRFSYYGFRYVQVEGASTDTVSNGNERPQILGIASLHTRNSTPFTGGFNCSNDFFNDVFSLIDYAIKSNLQSVVTDCPHREKLGWLEQTHLMGGSIHYNYHVYHLYKKLVHDMMDAQTEDGLIPNIAPEYVMFTEGFRDSPEWGSAGIILPWLIYKWYGDASVMLEAWPMMEKYIAYLDGMTVGHILSHGLGDWYDLGPEKPGYSQLTPMGLTATAIYYYDVKLMAQMAYIMEKGDRAKGLTEKAETIKKAFNDKFYDADKKVYATGSQTAMSMPLCIGLVNDADEEAVLNNMVDSIVANNKALTAGDIGFHYLVEALTDGGQSQLIYEMNNRDDVPGYGYQLKKGATALTESWQGLPIVSNNHLMLGHLMQWFYEGLAGINQSDSSVAYKQIEIKPKFVGDIDHVKGWYKSPYGKISSEWNRSDKEIKLYLEVPVNTSAWIYLPAKAGTVHEGGNKITPASDMEIVGEDAENVILKIGSGDYDFSFVLSR